MAAKAGRCGVLIPLSVSEGDVPLLREGGWDFNMVWVVLEAFNIVFPIAGLFKSWFC